MKDQNTGQVGLATQPAHTLTHTYQAYDGGSSEHKGSAGDCSDDCTRSYHPGAAPPIAAPIAVQRPPAAMYAARRWLVWREEPQDDQPKPRKVPYYVRGGRRRGPLDTPEDRAQLVTYAEAVNAMEALRAYSGLAFALGPDESGGVWQGIDLDDVQENQLADLAKELPGYVELSPSGNGCHAIGYGRSFATLGSNRTGIEAYAGRRYFTFTGAVIRSEEIGCLADYVEQKLTPRHGSVRGGGTASTADTHSSVDPKTVSHLRSALLFLRSDDYELWIAMGLALHELGEIGRGLWLEWSSTSEKFIAQEAAKKWSGFHPHSTGYQAVFAAAQRQGWVNPASTSAQIWSVDPATIDTGLAERQLKLLRVPYEADDPVDVPDIVDDLVADEELTLLGGHGGVGKSFLALQIACSVALGLQVLGKLVRRARRVLYYSAEDGRKRLVRRLRRICLECGSDAEMLTQNLLILDATDLNPLYGERIEEIDSSDGKRTYFNKVMGPTADFESLRGMVALFDPDLLIVDGASDAFDGNEIARREVRAFIRLMQRVHPARRIGVLMLVHTDRSSARGHVTDDDGYSGSSAWHNAARRRLYLKSEAKTRTLYLKVMKNQDGPSAPDIALDRVEGVIKLAVQFEGDLAPDHSVWAKAVLELIGEYYKRGQFIGTSLAPQATTGVYKTLKGDPKFPRGLSFAATCEIVRGAQRAGLLIEGTYKTASRKEFPCWMLKTPGPSPASGEEGCNGVAQ